MLLITGIYDPTVKGQSFFTKPTKLSYFPPTSVFLQNRSYFLEYVWTCLQDTPPSGNLLEILGNSNENHVKCSKEHNQLRYTFREMYKAERASEEHLITFAECRNTVHVLGLESCRSWNPNQKYNWKSRPQNPEGKAELGKRALILCCKLSFQVQTLALIQSRTDLPKFG